MYVRYMYMEKLKFKFDEWWLRLDYEASSNIIALNTSTKEYIDPLHVPHNHYHVLIQDLRIKISGTKKQIKEKNSMFSTSKSPSYLSTFQLSLEIALLEPNIYAQ